MNITARHRQAARTIWECGGRLDEAAAREEVKPERLRRWLADPQFRALLARDAAEPVIQATSAVLRWAPAAVARLIEDLKSESPSEARQAAREIIKLAFDAQQELAGPAESVRAAKADKPGADPAALDSPFARRVAALTDEQLARVMAIVNGEG